MSRQDDQDTIAALQQRVADLEQQLQTSQLQLTARQEGDLRLFELIVERANDAIGAIEHKERGGIAPSCHPEPGAALALRRREGSLV